MSGQLNHYDEATAAAYQKAREIPRDGLAHWHRALREHLRPVPDRVILDLGAGTGVFSTALADWFGVRVLAVEPATAMRARIPDHPLVTAVAGDAANIPAEPASLAGAWLSTVVHHVPDRVAAAHELRRVLGPGAPVLIRGVFRDRPFRVTLARYFPEVHRVLDRFPGVTEVCADFAEAGFRREALLDVPQTSAPDLGTVLARVTRRGDTLLRGLHEEEYAAGVARLRAAVEAGVAGPVVDRLDLLVLR
ncbi:ubiquinone/menaquinone biosynthesis C-methylase UbiE [Crossiella equi]|uniref:Ubiquinone/menaquinone biosynthesis C-methylase UbiE n=1 Tax=Crossiella equi TaxID=130796 RepID=A0ABS5AJ28_9PSEU|nr:class I SAM-dependent methyltransferase [Crossiella equi]MBP2475705.1 ubiquinone/menaquinone biosynthesis C-methylase UbiE [Crossiella equi]